MQEWVESVDVEDDATVVLNLTRPNPRFVTNFFGSCASGIRCSSRPRHIWENVDPLTFNNFDLEAGLPMGTGAYRLVRSTETEQVFDRRDDWWAAETGFHALPAPQRAIWLAAPR